MGKKHSNVKKNGESKGPSSSLDIFKTLFGEITEKGPSSSIFFDDNGNKKMAPSETSVFPLSPNGNPIWTSSTSSAHSSVSKLITSAISGNILSSIWPTPRCASPLLLTTSTLSTPPSSVDSAASSSATTPTGALSSAANPTSGSPIHSAMLFDT